jgi:two-component system, LuxR family, sensor kinase FixL
VQTKITNTGAGICLGLPQDESNQIQKQNPGLNHRAFLMGLFVFAGYYLGAQLGLALTFQPYPVSVMWPTNVVLLAALLLSPPRHWLFLVLCAFPAHLIVELHGGIPPGMVLCWFASNISEALIGAVSARLLLGDSPRFSRIRNIVILLFCGALLGPFLSSFLDSAFVSLNHWGHQGYWQVWRMRLFSNAFSAFIFLPVILAWGARRIKLMRGASLRRLVEAAAGFFGLTVVSITVFYLQDIGSATTTPALFYVPLPFLLWIAVRFGVTETSTATCAVALIAIWGAVHGRGPFASHSPEQNALSIQMFFSVVSVTLLSLTVAIGERRRAEERFTKAFHSSPDAILISHLKDGHIVEMNERCEKMLGFQRYETLGRTVFDINMYTSQADRERLVAGTAAGNSLHDLALCLRTKTGELLYTLVSADMEEISGENCLIIVIRDISDRKRAEEAQENLAHASRLAVVGELTAMIAHEINQPLGAILSNAEAAEMLLESEKPALEEIRLILADIRKNDLRADEAIRRIRDLLRKHETQMKPLDINETISDVLRLVTGDTLRRNIEVRRDLARSLPPAFGDKIYLQQVLLNLIVNGMDAMNEIPESERRMTIQTKQKDNHHIEVTVADSGPGIVPDKMPFIFESFFTTKHNGLGLGLSIARSIIETHQGRLWVENNPDCGATFHFTVQTAPNGDSH